MFTMNIIVAKDFETLLENYFGGETPVANDQIDLSQLQDLFEFYSENQLNINKASIRELVKLPFVNKSLIKDLRKNKTFKTKSELINAIDSLNTDDITKFVLKECLTIKSIKKQEYEASYRIRNKSTLQEKKGFKDGKYLGSPLNMYQKLNLKSPYLELYTIMDKDAGEVAINDFTSASLKYENDGLKVIVGDYNLFYGLGNIIDQSFFSFKNASFISTATEFGNGGSQNKSTLGSNFFRGLFAEYSLPLSYVSNLKISAFYSNYDRTATIDTNRNIVTSIYKSGYYRTQTAYNNFGNLNEKLFGLSAEYNSSALTLGIFSNYLKYNNYILSSSFADFSGKEAVLSSIYVAYNQDRYNIKSELGIDGKQNISVRTNYLIKINSGLSFLTELRFTEPEYRAPYASNFGEQPYLSNEKGVLSGINYTKDNLQLSLFTDIYRSDYRTYSTTQPISGVQYYLDLKYKQEYTDYAIRINFDQKSDAFNLNNANSKVTEPNHKITTRFDINKQFVAGYKFRARLEFSYKYNDINADETGKLIQFELKKDYKNINLYTGINYTIFNTTSFESVIYGYQYQVPGLAYVYPYYGRGTNLSLFAKYKLLEYLDLWIRYNHLFKSNEDTIGTGDELIVGNMRSQLIFQLQLNVD